MNMSTHPNRRQACGLLLATTMTPPAAAAEPTGFAHVPWSHQTSIYEVNIRQFTPEGTLKAFEAHLPRLQQMGVSLLWFMPIQPIGKKERKGGLGSYYAIQDYTAVNPEFGTLEDFRRIVAKAHAMGMKVILDWVANHTAWDHPWVGTHKERYKLNEKGDVYSVTFNAGTPQVEYWTDVVGLNYQDPGLWLAMTDAMAWWLKEADIDGFRCDVASLVPTPFWEQARARLDRIKPVFMLAESDKADLHAKAFDMTYDWDLFDQLRDIAKGKADASALKAWWARREAKYPSDAYRMNFTANHDSNSWHGSCKEFYGTQACFKAMAVLAATLPGVPLIYGGQESFLDKRLAFFEKDPIAWAAYPLAGFYAGLLDLKQRRPELANGQYAGTLAWLETGDPAVVGFRRERGTSRVDVYVNLGALPRQARAAGGDSLRLPPWAWAIQTS
jgi:glycosidase